MRYEIILKPVAQQQDVCPAAFWRELQRYTAKIFFHRPECSETLYHPVKPYMINAEYKNAVVWETQVGSTIRPRDIGPPSGQNSPPRPRKDGR